MGLSNSIRNMTGIVTVQVEGFFTERFINLCKINNVKIWDIRNIVKGIVRFKMNVSDFKKLRMIARKTKCKVTIKKKEGLYFLLFKYRNRKLAFILVGMVIFFSIAFSTFIWNINVEGNIAISEEEIIDNLKNSGIYIGKSKLGLDKKDVTNNLRVNMQDLSWVGLEIDGTTAKVKVVEKTKLDDKHIQNNRMGDIVANKTGVITRIVSENGTAMLNEGSYVENGSVLIEGMIYSKFMEPTPVTAKGIVRINSEYLKDFEYKYEDITKDYTGKTRYTIGLGINSNENILNYLNKSKKYDINRSSKTLNLFGLQLSFDLYKCVEYVDKTEIKTREEILEQSKKDIEEYLNSEILKNISAATLVEIKTEYIDTEDGIVSKNIYVINEQIGEFVER